MKAKKLSTLLLVPSVCLSGAAIIKEIPVGGNAPILSGAVSADFAGIRSLVASPEKYLVDTVSAATGAVVATGTTSTGTAPAPVAPPITNITPPQPVVTPAPTGQYAGSIDQIRKNADRFYSDISFLKKYLKVPSSKTRSEFESNLRKALNSGYASVKSILSEAQTNIANGTFDVNAFNVKMSAAFDAQTSALIPFMKAENVSEFKKVMAEKKLAFLIGTSGGSSYGSSHESEDDDDREDGGYQNGGGGSSGGTTTGASGTVAPTPTVPTPAPAPTPGTTTGASGTVTPTPTPAPYPVVTPTPTPTPTPAPTPGTTTGASGTVTPTPAPAPTPTVPSPVPSPAPGTTTGASGTTAPTNSGSYTPGTSSSGATTQPPKSALGEKTRNAIDKRLAGKSKEYLQNVTNKIDALMQKRMSDSTRKKLKELRDMTQQAANNAD